MKEVQQERSKNEIQDWWDVQPQERGDNMSEIRSKQESQVGQEDDQAEEEISDEYGLSSEDEAKPIEDKAEENNNTNEKTGEYTASDQKYNDGALDLTKSKVPNNDDEVCFGDFELGVISATHTTDDN